MAFRHVVLTANPLSYMCTVFFAYKVSDKYPFIVAANRDEFYQRNTAALEHWDSGAIGGKDLKAGGQWMACNQYGRFAALTNFRRPAQKKQSNFISRGKLVSDFIHSSQNPATYLSEIHLEADQYDGFNLILKDESSIWHYSNISKKSTELKPGVYGLSNALLDTPWPKVKEGKAAFRLAIESANLTKNCFSLLKNSEQHADEALPKTGVPITLERMLSACFIKSPAYGTRSCSVLTISEKDIYFEERRYGVMGRKIDANTVCVPLLK